MDVKQVAPTFNRNGKGKLTVGLERKSGGNIVNFNASYHAQPLGESLAGSVLPDILLHMFSSLITPPAAGVNMASRKQTIIICSGPVLM